MYNNANIAPCLVHARSLVPSVGNGIVTAHRVEMIAAIKAADHVDQIAQRAQPVVGPWR